MDERVQIPIETLRRAARILIDHLELVEGETVALEKDLFWTISPDQRNDVYNEPSEFSIGQIAESLSHLERLVSDSSNVTSYGLVWLADVCRALGESVVR